MKILITESQNRRLLEYFAPIEYLKFLLSKKEPGLAKDFDRYKAIKAFQKYVDLIYKYTKKSEDFEGVKGIKVATVWKEPWGTSFSNPKLPPSRFDYRVRVYPILDETNPPSSKEIFDQQYLSFQKEFLEISEGMGLDIIQPVKDKKTKDVKITFDFLQLDIPKTN